MNKKVFKWILKNGKESFIFIALLTVASVALSLISLQFSMESKKMIDIATGVSDGAFSECLIRIVALLLCMLIIQISINQPGVKFILLIIDYMVL